MSCIEKNLNNTQIKIILPQLTHTRHSYYRFKSCNMVMLIENTVGEEQYSAIIECYASHDTTPVSNAGTVINI